MFTTQTLKLIMKCKPFFILSWGVFSLSFLSSCNSESERNKSHINFASIYQESWKESSKNMYKIYLSMRKIDSLSAELNLKFTRKNVQGL